MTGHPKHLAFYHLARYSQYPLDDACSAEIRNELKMHFRLLSVPVQECHGVTFTFNNWMRD